MYGWELRVDSRLCVSLRQLFFFYIFVREGRFSPSEGESQGLIFWGHVHMYRAGGRVHRDTAPITRCIHWRSWINMVVKSRVRTTTTTSTTTTTTPPLSPLLSSSFSSPPLPHHHHHLRSHFGSSKTSCRSFYLRRSQGNHRKGTLFSE